MFRISQYMRELAQAEKLGHYPAVRERSARGPVVIWNLIRRCNLTCKHCYALSADHDYAGELTLDEVFAVMEDLKAFGVPALILSGGSRCCARTSSRSPPGRAPWAFTPGCRPTAR